MKILGLYAELWEDRAGNPVGRIRDFVRDAAGPDEEAVIAYVRSGRELLSVMGSSEDVLGSGQQILGGDSLYTDGEWVWRGDLWFYLRDYHVQLPVEFLDQVRASGYTMPSIPENRFIELSDALDEII